MEDYVTLNDYWEGSKNNVKMIIENLSFKNQCEVIYRHLTNSKNSDSSFFKIEDMLKEFINYCKKEVVSYDVNDMKFYCKNDVKDYPFYVIEIGCIHSCLNDSNIVDLDIGTKISKIDFLKVLLEIIKMYEISNRRITREQLSIAE